MFIKVRNCLGPRISPSREAERRQLGSASARGVGYLVLCATSLLIGRGYDAGNGALGTLLGSLE